MAKSVPDYLQRQVFEGQGDVEAQRAELMLCQIEATEAQTEVLERIAEALEHGTRKEMDALVAMIGERFGDPNFERVFAQDVRGAADIDATVADHKQTARRGY